MCYLRDGDRVFETYWTTGRGCETMGNSYGMLDMTVYGRQETWEDSPEGWPQALRHHSEERTDGDGVPSIGRTGGRSRSGRGSPPAAPTTSAPRAPAAPDTTCH